MLALQRLVPGTRVKKGNSRYKVLDLLDDESVLVQSESKKDKEVVLATELDIAEAPSASEDLADKDVDERWEQALSIFRNIKPLVELGPRKRKREDVEALAKKIKSHPATVYRWLRAYESTGLVSSLMRPRRSDRGKSRLEPRVEEIIQEQINRFYLTDQKTTPAATAKEVKKACKAEGLTPPDPKTITNRINKVDDERKVAKRESYKAAKERYQPIRGYFPGADWPLAIVQIDHTPMDVIIVDDVHRLPIGRPYLTLATDIFSRMVVGFYISLDPPSALSTGICIANAILTKEDFLKRIGTDLPWPCWGVMRTVHTDNASEFRGKMMGRACERYGIVLEHRPKGSPNYGGHVERIFRTHMGKVHNELPGTTFSNIQDRGEYDSEGRAVMTLDALEKWFTLFILGVYHQEGHSGIAGLPPLVKWKEGIYGSDTQLGTGIPARVPDEKTLRLDFLPFFERTVQRYGIANRGIHYWHDAMRHLVLAKDPDNSKLMRKFICRYDPRDLSRIWLYLPDDNQYIEVPYRDLTRPPISEWELKEAQRRLKEKSLSVTNEELIFKTIDQMRSIVEEDSGQTTWFDNQKFKHKKAKKDKKDSVPVTAVSAIDTATSVEDTDELGDVSPFEDIQEPE